MGWSTTLTDQLRYIVGDFSDSPTYSDAQMVKFLGIACNLVNTDLLEYESQISGPYTVNTATTGDYVIQPDPISNGPVALTNMLLAKASALIAQSELRKIGITAGWKIVDDRSQIDGTQAVVQLKNYKDTAENFYLSIMNEFKKGNQSAGMAIMSPYASANYSQFAPAPWYNTYC